MSFQVIAPWPMLALLCFSAPVMAQFQGEPDPPLPARAYQPHLIDPGLYASDGDNFLGGGDLTSDGKLLLGFRDTRTTWPLTRMALIAAVTRIDRFQTNVHGYLSGFFVPPVSGSFGSQFVFGNLSEQSTIHFGFVPDATNPNDQSAQYAVPGNYGNAHFTVSLRPLSIGNPYPSDLAGNVQNGGPYTCYKIWYFGSHTESYEDNLDGDPNDPDYLNSSSNPNGEPLVVDAAQIQNLVFRFTCQDLTVIVDERTQPPTIVATGVDSAAQNITGPAGEFIYGFEPSVTADGRLVVYQGNGNSFPAVANAKVNYIYNDDPCSPTGWTAPRTITQLPTFTDDPPGGLTAAQKIDRFKKRYKLFAQPIRMPPIHDVGGGYPYSNGYTFNDGIVGSADEVSGAYLWVSKDGSFFVAQGSGSDEAVGSGGFPEAHMRTGAYVCGDITGGYIKHIDDVGLNPTRLGGPWRWPRTYAAFPSPSDSWRTFIFSTGLKPGMWEPLIGQGAPFPTTIASTRVPVLPLISPQTHTYGEVRFEEADGNYLIYLACNESLMIDGTAAPGNANVMYDTLSTPDTSGRATRATCTLNVGAGFPQEVMGSTQSVRDAIGAAIGSNYGITGPLHECVGFKGQAIVFNATGNIDVRNAPGIAGLQTFTAQAFVKLVSTPSSAITLLESGSVNGSTFTPNMTLKLDSGRLEAKVFTTLTGGGNASIQVESRLNPIPVGSLVNPETAWRHVAVVYEGNTGSYTRLKIYLDGILDKAAAVTGASTVRTSSNAPYYLVGPGRATANPVDDFDKLLVMDEVAFSDLRRGGDELRRDAYVVSLPPAFESWPAGAPALPQGLDPEQAKWPTGVAFDPEIVTLGRDLFIDPVLSPPAVGRQCATCHIPAERFADQGQQRALDINGLPLEFNTPSLLNAVFGTHKLFDGSAASIEDQVWRPILSGTEMGTQTVTDVLARINASSFGPRFTDPATFGAAADQDNVATALAMYVRTLNTGQTAYDNQLFFEATGAYLPGLPIMTNPQLYGRALFFGKARCFGCHRGSAFTDDDFHNIHSVPASATNAIRGSFTGRVNEDGRVKTPSLRNVQHTAPYFHDGSKAGLLGVVNHYNNPPTGSAFRGTLDMDLRPLDLTATEKGQLLDFLTTLSTP